MATLSELVQKVVVRLSQVPGVGVQLFSEDRVAAMLQSTFNALFDKYWWPQFLTTASFTLDGTTGKVTASLTSSIKRWEDVDVVWASGDNYRLALYPRTENPLLVTGTTPRYIEPTADNKIFRVLPITSTGDIVVRYRTKPATFVPADTVNMDEDILVFGSVYEFLEDDGTNPNQTEKYRNMFNERLQTLLRNQNNQPHNLDSRYHRGARLTWQETP